MQNLEGYETCQKHPNGVLLASFATKGGGATAPGRIVLVYVSGAAQPYVTWWENTQVGGCLWGHYFNDLESAKVDFLKRCMATIPHCAEALAA